MSYRKRPRTRTTPGVLYHLVLVVGGVVAVSPSMAAPMSDAEAVGVVRGAVTALGAAMTVNVLPFDRASEARAAGITVVVGDSRRSSDFAGVSGNCSADARTRMIECDMRLIDDLIDEADLLRTEDERGSYRTALMTLVLAHEIGHVALGHRGARYHGSDLGFSVLRYASHRRELAADRYAVGLLDRARPGVRGPYSVVVELTYAAMKRSLCPDTFPAACACPGHQVETCSQIAYGPGLPLSGEEEFQVTLKGTHPEYIVRFARLLHLSRDPNVRIPYARTSREVLRRVVVRDERGVLQSMRPLFR